MRHFGPISSITVYQDKYVATAGYDNLIVIWDGNTKTPINRSYHDHLVNQCAFSPNGRYLVSASSDYTARLWEVPTMRLLAVLVGHSDDVEMAAFNSEGDLIATCSRDHTIKIFGIDGRLKSTLQGHEADVISVTWKPNSRYLISSSDDGTVRRWNAENGQLIETINFNGVQTDTIVITHNDVIFAGDDEGKISAINSTSVNRIPAHNAGIKRLIYSEAKRLLVSLSYDHKLIIWLVSPDSGLTKICTADLPYIVWPRSCAFFANSKLVFGTFGSTFATYNYDTKVWDVKGIEPDISLNAVTYTQNKTYTVGDAGIVFCNDQPIAKLGSLCNFLLPFGNIVITGGQLGIVFNAINGKVIYQHHSPLNCGATFVKDGLPHTLIGTYTGDGLVFQQNEYGVINFVKTIKLHNNAIKGVSAGNDTIFSVCATGTAAFHHISDFECTLRIKNAHDKIANGCTAIDRKRFASISRDLKLRLWNGNEVEVISTPHKNSIKCIASSIDGVYIATGSYTGTVAIFDVAKKIWVLVVRPTDFGISSITAIGEANTFIASSYNGQLYVICADKATQ
ncbi:MAG: WD40 repeat domain-containing protein [Rhizonema sp. PD37]|nr:WD40 repeat domain-containing protein [Rhizonema sp. PD37]